MLKISKLIILFLFSLFIISCHHRNDDDDKMIFRYNEAVGIQSLDPAFSSGQAALWPCNMLYNGLVDLDDSLKVIPMIAKHWDISEDGKVYTFFLRDDVYFHQTEHFTFPEKRKVVASDFVYSLSRILDPETASPGAWIFQKVARDEANKPMFKAIDDTTFQITLAEPFPPFLSILAMKYCSVIPFEVVEHYGKDFRKFPVGTGPFKMQLWEEGVKLVLRKNELYFEKDEQGNQLPYLDAVAISFIIDKQAQFMEFMKGSIDFMSGVDPCYKDALLTRAGTLNPDVADQMNMITAPYLNTEYLGFLLKNDDPNNPLLKKEVRQAINYGFDREKMIRYLRNNIGNAQVSGFVPEGMLSFNAERVKGYDYNPEKALELLAQAGYPNGKGMPEIALSVSAAYLDLCQYIQHDLGLLGIPVRLDVQQAAQQREMMRNYKLPFFRGSWVCDYPDSENYLSLFYSKNLQPIGSNYTHYINPEFDKLFEKSQTITDDSLRNEYYTQLDSLLTEDAPVVVLFYDKLIHFTQKNVKGLTAPPTNMINLKRVTIER